MVTIPAMTFRDTLKAWRLLQGLTQAEAAQKLGVPLRTLNNWERASRPVVPRDVVRLAVLRQIQARRGK